MSVNEVNAAYHRLRELAFEDPLATKNDFLAILAQDHATAVAILRSSTDQRGSRFRQITARSLSKGPLPSDIEQAFLDWIPHETDEFALSAIRGALSSKATHAPSKRQKQQVLPPPLELEGTYRYVAGRLRHRVLNALPGAGMAIQKLKLDVQNAGSQQLTATLSQQLDNLYGHLSKLENAVKFDEDETYFQGGPIELFSWLKGHQRKFASEYAQMSLVLDWASADHSTLVFATPYWLETTFTNLWKNSLDAVGREGCQVTVTASKVGKDLSVIVCDNGLGLRHEDLELAFQFQFSTKSSDRGRGHLEVRDAMERMGGLARVVEASGGYRVQLVFRCTEK